MSFPMSGLFLFCLAALYFWNPLGSANTMSKHNQIYIYCFFPGDVATHNFLKIILQDFLLETY